MIAVILVTLVQPQVLNLSEHSRKLMMRILRSNLGIEYTDMHFIFAVFLATSHEEMTTHIEYRRMRSSHSSTGSLLGTKE